MLATALKRPVPLLLMFALALPLAACSTPEDQSSASSDAGLDPDREGVSDDLSAFESEIAEKLEAASQEQTTAPPESGPAAVPDKEVYIIPCTMSAEGCARTARAAEEAAETIGWKSTTVDPAFDFTAMDNAVQKAVAAGVDGIIFQGIDAEWIPSALQAAKAADIPMVCWVCENESGLYADVIPPTDTYFEDGYLQTAEAYRQTGGDLRMAFVKNVEFFVARERQRGAMQFVDECIAAGGDCEIVGEVTVALADTATRGPEQVVSLVRDNTDANVVWVAYDALAGFVLPALEQAALPGGEERIVVSFDANEVNLDSVRNGGLQSATIGQPATWIGYAEVDALNRIFAGEAPVDSGVRSKVLNRDNAPESGAWDGDISVRDYYTSVWMP